ncbi:hypothetical protein [Reinekea sp.]|jgi:hypothetical protein|uniref:hypothetical protein n=1 Tax=Reinekea sp. TaxID=1970455 RepID=UPI0039891671
MLFHYTRSRKRQAATLAFNILLIPILLYVLTVVAKDQAGFYEVYATVKFGAFAIGLVLFTVMLWFLLSKDKFEIYVTRDEFHSLHPSMEEWCFTVSPQDIESINNHYSSGSQMTRIDMLMKDGNRYQICPNYNYSKTKLFSALKQANPSIEIPENAHTFKKGN